MARKSAMLNRPTVKGKQASSGVSKKASETYISMSTLQLRDSKMEHLIFSFCNLCIQMI